MMKRKRPDGKPEVMKGIRTDVYESLSGGGVVETDWVVGIRHLPVQYPFQGFGRTAGMEDDLAGGRVKGREIRQTLNVVPVEMRKQQMELQIRPGTLHLQLRSKFAYACSCVNDDDAFWGPDLDTRGVATEGDKIVRRNRY